MQPVLAKPQVRTSSKRKYVSKKSNESVEDADDSSFENEKETSEEKLPEKYGMVARIGCKELFPLKTEEEIYKLLE